MGVLSSAYTAQSGPPNAYPTNKKQGGTGGSSSRTSSSVPSIGLGSVPGPSSRPPAVPNPNDIIVQNPGADYAKSLTDTFNGLMAANASQMAGFGNSVADANRKLAYQPALYGNSQDALTNAFNQGVANININRIGNAIDQGAAQRDYDYYGDVYNNTLKGYLTNYDFLNQQQGFATRDYSTDWDFLNQQAAKSTEDLGFRDRGFDNQLADAGMAQQARDQQIREAIATGGGGLTQGIGADRKQSNYLFDAAGRDIGLQREQSRSDYGFEQSGISRDRTKLQTGYDRDIARGLNNLIDYKTAPQCPTLHEDLDVFGGAGTYELVRCRPIWIGQGILAAYHTIKLEAAPYFDSTDGNTATVRITLSKLPPSGDTRDDVTFFDPYVQVSFSTTSTTPAIATAQDIDTRHVNRSESTFGGWGFLSVEINSKVSMGGVGHLLVGPRETP